MNTENLSPWQRFVNLISLEKKDIFQIFYYAIFSGLIGLTIPLGIQYTIVLIQSGEISTSWILLVVAITLGVFATGIFQVMQLRIIEDLQQRIFVKSSIELSYRFPKIQTNALRNSYPPELANRFFDTLSIQKGLTKVLIDVPTAILQILFGILLLSFYHPFFIFFGITLLALISLLFKFTAEKGLKTSLAESKEKYKVAHWIQEIARSIVSFKISGGTNLAVENTDKLVSSYIDKREKHFRVMRSQFFKLVGFKVIVTIGLLIVGGLLVLDQQMSIGQFVAAEIVILLMLGSVEKLIGGLESIYDILTSIEKLGQVVDLPLESQNGIVITELKDFSLELRDISFRVPKRRKPILDNINLEITNTSRILIKGDSGAGKSTLLNILTGIESYTSGLISLNNQNLKSIKLNSYRAQIGMVLEDEAPFLGTLRENISFSNPDITDREITDTIDLVGLNDFFIKLESGLDTMLHPEGKQLSTSVIKRIILARALVKPTGLYIMEDPLVSLEPNECKAIIDYMMDPKQPWGVVIVSENKYWEEKSNEIITLKEGKIN